MCAAGNLRMLSNPVVIADGNDVVENPVEQRGLTIRYMEKAQEFMRTNQNNPFFLYLAHNMPHTPLYTSDQFEGVSPYGFYGDAIEEIDTPRKHYRLLEQLESSCTSVALNISEGKGRFSKKDFKRFLYIARGSLYETVTMLQIFLKKNWLGQTYYEKLYSEAEEINKMLSGLINSISD